VAWPPAGQRKKERWESGCLVKSRNEPCRLAEVLCVVAGARGEPLAEVAAALWDNTQRLFFPDTTTAGDRDVDGGKT